VKSLFSSLNEQQQQAVRTTEGAVRVSAGAGTGKTRTLISRYCYLVSELGIAPGTILCVTFTNRAADVMKRRVRKLLGDMDLGYICTFHAFCVQFLKEEIHVLNYPKKFIILDREDQKQILERIFADMHLTLRDTTMQRTIDDVLESKKMQTETYIADITRLDNEQLRSRFETAGTRDDRIFIRYLYEQKKSFGLDFNDLINFTLYILEHFPVIRKKWQQRMEYVMVDEFQDVSKKQYDIARHLSALHGNLFIVGDSDQTIYSWRGSHVRLFLDFDKAYPGARTFVLSLNYRSTPEILRAADALISHNKVRFPKKLQAVNSPGPRPLYRHCRDEKEEAQWIGVQIERLHNTGIGYGSAAVLYRSHFLSRSIEECLIRQKIPYTFYSGTEFYSRREIKDCICYLRMITAGDDMAFLRTINVPSRKIGKRKLEALRIAAEKNSVSLYEMLKQTVQNQTSPLAAVFEGTGAARYIAAIEYLRSRYTSVPLGTIFQMILDRSGYESYLRLQGDQNRLDNVAELKRAVEKEGQDADATLENFLQHSSLYTDLDREQSGDRVKLMTIHTAKGMEFPYIFICGLNEGGFPARKTITPEDMEEERRIAYVAMTRAKKLLFLTDSEGIANDGISKYPSRFIFDAGKENIDYEIPLDKSLEEQARSVISYDEKRLLTREELLKPGTKVFHPLFGEGIITEIDDKNSCYIIQFSSLKTSRSIRFGTKLGKN
jgi:DNA helicase-2/ATP-dependent DNA helicase PcrA